MTRDASGLLDRHLAFIEALRGAGLSVSLAEDLDSVAALGAVGWGDRAQVRDVLAATLVKKQAQRTTFDALFDVYFPRARRRRRGGPRPGGDRRRGRRDRLHPGGPRAPRVPRPARGDPRRR
ncbi:hypothetical protein [Nocardioides sp. TF02-7]|uniref:hypothetical protein n=1 Tax=Nocardioides sp. TF02-7 TaxID=2917724 RepID=UPI001F05A1DF|nr:hypothetical protein [Nocardioides sp. TF02-7]UMG94515.1 hypothetical protein MF408_11420 [Nocardioides sp. TF02-7]